MSFLIKAIPMSFPTYILPSLPFRRQNSADSTHSASSTASKLSISPTNPPDDEPSGPRNVPPGHTSFIRCASCAAELCLTSQVVSRGFTGRYGAAYLVAPLDDNLPPPPGGIAASSSSASSGAVDGTRGSLSMSMAMGMMSPAQAPASHRTRPLPNTSTLQVMRRNFVTGGHTVCDVICRCGAQIGWKYINADEESQRYKIGKFILETKLTTVTPRWEDDAGCIGDDTMVGGRRLQDLMRPAVVDGEDVEFDSQDDEECEDLFMGLWSSEQALRRRKAKRLAGR